MRWLDPETTAAAANPAVTDDQVRIQCRIDADDAENLAQALSFRAAAINIIEQISGTRLVTQTVKLRAWGLDECAFRLPIAPVSAIASIKYLDAAGVEQTLDSGLYVTALYGLAPTVALKANQTWPAHLCQLGSVTIECTAGYGAQGSAPGVVQQAVLVANGEFYANREAGALSSEALAAIQSLLVNHSLNA